MDDTKALQAIRDLIAAIGDNPDRPGLRATPERVWRAWRDDWGSGYAEQDAASLFTLFEPYTDKITVSSAFHPHYDQMVVVRDLAFVSHCEHHMAPFFGEVHIAYVPCSRGLLGLSKLARVVDLFSRRLQMQERLTNDIAGILQERLSPHIGVLVRARHMCMISRGVRQPRSTTITTALRGNFYDDARTRDEFMRVCGSDQSDPR